MNHIGVDLINHLSDDLGMDILDAAISKAGGVNKLADALGVRQNVISMWRVRRVPRPWLLVLTERYGPGVAAPEGVPPVANTEGAANA